MPSGRVTRRFAIKEDAMKVKRKLPPILKAWGECRRATGILPGKKMSKKQYGMAKSCVSKKMSRVSGHR
jgi:hypothetical protein